MLWLMHHVGVGCVRTVLLIDSYPTPTRLTNLWKNANRFCDANSLTKLAKLASDSDPFNVSTMFVKLRSHAF
jgi:hypothetical protein